MRDRDIYKDHGSIIAFCSLFLKYMETNSHHLYYNHSRLAYIVRKSDPILKYIGFRHKLVRILLV